MYCWERADATAEKLGTILDAMREHPESEQVQDNGIVAIANCARDEGAGGPVPAAD